VIAADDDETAQRQLHLTRRARVQSLFRRGGQQRLTDEEADQVLDSPQAMHVDQMMTYTAVGTPDVVTTYLDDFADLAGADELMVVHQGDSIERRLRSLELLAMAADLAAA
jgi:alkanesulfonate monooxygenase SsuD/methylene tetrahydromethanopterin reductase-like flavin-dependent oxidoreductase (luciferase family)